MCSVMSLPARTHHATSTIALTCTEVGEEEVPGMVQGQLGVVPRDAEVLHMHVAVRVPPHEAPLGRGPQAQRQAPHGCALL